MCPLPFFLRHFSHTLLPAPHQTFLAPSPTPPFPGARAAAKTLFQAPQRPGHDPAHRKPAGGWKGVCGHVLGVLSLTLFASTASSFRFACRFTFRALLLYFSFAVCICVHYGLPFHCELRTMCVGAVWSCLLFPFLFACSYVRFSTITLTSCPLFRSIAHPLVRTYPSKSTSAC